MKRFALLALLALLSMLSFNILAEKLAASGEWAWTPDTLSHFTEPPMWVVLRESPPKPLATIDRIELSAPDKLEDVRTWNKGGFDLPKNGISHILPSEAHVSFSPDTTSVEGLTEAVKENQHGQIMQMADGSQRAGGRLRQSR